MERALAACGAGNFPLLKPCGRLLELVDRPDLKSEAFGRVGSSPTAATTFPKKTRPNGTRFERSGVTFDQAASA